MIELKDRTVMNNSIDFARSRQVFQGINFDLSKTSP